MTKEIKLPKVTKEELLEAVRKGIFDAVKDGYEDKPFGDYVLKQIEAGIYNFLFDMNYKGFEPYAIRNAIEEGCAKGIAEVKRKR